jgi:hypothetical protein
MTQAARVLALLKSRGSQGVTFLDFPQGFRLGARIFDLKASGHDIDPIPVELPGGTRTVRYVIRSTPTAPVPMAGSQESWL